MPTIPSPGKPASVPMIPAGKVSGISTGSSAPSIKANLVDKTAQKINLNLNVQG